MNTGGSAFPRSESLRYSEYITGGMTLRDYFAAKAMQGFVTDKGEEIDFAAAAADSYTMADAMLKERDNNE